MRFSLISTFICCLTAILFSMAPLPAGWPAGLQIGMADAPGGAAAMKLTAPFGFRYQYLCAGVNTGSGWYTWNTNGDFVTYYIQNSVASAITPVFTYYQIYQSKPGSTAGESQAVLANLQTDSTMVAYYTDLKRFFQKAGAFPSAKVVLHVEPDMWGYMQQKNGDNAASTVVRVTVPGFPELSGLPNTASGFARALVALRNAYAPNVLLAYHLSLWGTNTDLNYSDPPDPVVDSLARRSAAFYNSLQAAFDLSFGEFTDRDSDFKRYQNGDNGASWWNAADFARHARFLGVYSNAIHKRLVMWQIPYGNTKMRACDNTWGHYQDNRVEWFFDDSTRAHLDAYAQAGVAAFLFGGGASGTTSAGDAIGDDITNPAPVNGNTLMSLSADDDGGFFRQKAAAYYSKGAMTLPIGIDPRVQPGLYAAPKPMPGLARVMDGRVLFAGSVKSVSVFNVKGETLFRASQSASSSRGMVWDFSTGRKTAAGVYLFILKQTDGSTTAIRLPIIP